MSLPAEHKTGKMQSTVSTHLPEHDVFDADCDESRVRVGSKLG